MVKSITPHLVYRLNGMHHVVAQVGVVNGDHVFALQLLHSAHDVLVYRKHEGLTKNIDYTDPHLVMMGFGHTQTWVAANDKDEYFVGAKPNSGNWTTQIARVKYPRLLPERYTSNTQLPRLSHLNHVTDVPYDGHDHLHRVEASVSPNGKYFMIASIWDDGSGHFGLFDLNEVNQKLNENGTKNTPITDLHCLSAFHIDNFDNPSVAPDEEMLQMIDSVQGYAIDDDKNIYISNQLSPKIDHATGEVTTWSRKIVKFPWGETNPENWQVAMIDGIDLPDRYSEVESIHVQAPDDIYLTVAYHQKYVKDGEFKLRTLENQIFHISDLG